VKRSFGKRGTKIERKLITSAKGGGLQGGGKHQPKLAKGGLGGKNWRRKEGEGGGIGCNGKKKITSPLGGDNAPQECCGGILDELVGVFWFGNEKKNQKRGSGNLTNGPLGPCGRVPFRGEVVLVVASHRKNSKRGGGTRKRKETVEGANTK